MAAGVAPSVEFLSINTRLWVQSSEPLRPAEVRQACLPSPGGEDQKFKVILYSVYNTRAVWAT